jgi:hypothetical protein
LGARVGITITLDEYSEDTNFFISQEIRVRMGSTPGVPGSATNPFKLFYYKLKTIDVYIKVV